MRRIVSAIIFGFGLAYGLMGCATLPGAVFCIGVNDSKAEVVAMAVCIPGTFAAAVLSFWRRGIAAIVYLILPEIFLYGVARQYQYMTQVRHFDQGPFLRYLLQLCVPCVPLWLVGGFALWTALRGWPEVLGKKKDEDGVHKNTAIDS